MRDLTVQPTISLSIMSREYDDNVIRVINSYGRFFDEVYIQLNGGDKPPQDIPEHVHISTFRWCDDFSKARNALLKHVQTDFWMWIDSDDEIIQPEQIRELVNLLQVEQADTMELLYEYDSNPGGDLTAIQWRERIMRTAHPYVWKRRVHECLFSDIPHKVLHIPDKTKIQHLRKSQSMWDETAQRNFGLLDQELKSGNREPILLYYQALNHYVLKEYSTVIKLLEEAYHNKLQNELSYDVLLRLAHTYLMLTQIREDRSVYIEKARDTALEAVKMYPQWPDAFYLVGNSYMLDHLPAATVEWYKIGLTKNRLAANAPLDPTLYTYQPHITLAQAYVQLGDLEEAKRSIDRAAQFDPKSKNFAGIYQDITQAYNEENAIIQVANLGRIIKQNGGNPKKYIDGLPAGFRNDRRLRELLIQVHKPKQWNDKSIVIYCGQHLEFWGPDTLRNGMGGAEEAIVYLSAELAKLGWEVTVYNHRSKRLKTKGVEWLPWQEFNAGDLFNIFVAWRDPWLITRSAIQARLRVFDMHDFQPIPPQGLADTDLVMFKSQFQRRNSPDVPDDKAHVISNGIVAEQFKPWTEKRQPLKVIYASSADRGLDVLVNIWPEIARQVPGAELVWAYGWDTYDLVHQNSPERMAWKTQLQNSMNEIGVQQLGRLDHQTLSREMQSSAVWAYPTSFPEINCITALKMQAAGVDPITSGFAALQETVMKKERQIENIEGRQNEQLVFLARVVLALKNPIMSSERRKISQKIITQYNWTKVAQQWDLALKSRIKEFTLLSTRATKKSRKKPVTRVR